MNESLKEKIKRIAKDKLGIRSWRDQVDENFANGTQVASAPFARAGKIIKGLQTDALIDRLLKADEDLKNGLITKEERANILKGLQDKTRQVHYYKKLNGANEFDNTPRDIIRNDTWEFPSDIVGEDLNAKVADVKKAREGFIKRDESAIASASGYRGYHPEDVIGKDEYKMWKDREPSNDTKIDGKAWLKQKQEGKEAGKEIAKQFSEQNKKEKAKYRQISMGATYSNSFIPDGYTGKLYKVTSKTDPSSSSIITQKQLDDADEELKTLWKVEEVKPTKALGGQNTKYLDRSLDKESPQDLETMAKSAKPIHYDENGNPYVRGYTWTQTDNVPKITNPDVGYLASVGADTKIYHAGATPGHWTSEGWGNPMDLNYENGLAPGQVVNGAQRLKYDKKIEMLNNLGLENETESLWNDFCNHRISRFQLENNLNDMLKQNGLIKDVNFDEQLLETRWPLKWYQKAPSEHQPDAGEKVTIMNAGPGAKDIHRPVIKEVSDSRSNREFEALQNEFMDRFQLPQEALMHQYRRKIDSEGWSPELEEWYKSERKKFTEDPEFSRMYKLISLGPKKVPTTVGTKVDKIATPASMITAHMEDYMPRNWSMRDRQNGGQSIAGWHPNKKWSSWTAGDFANHVKENMPELYKQLSDEAEKEFGKSVDARKNAKNIHNYIGQYFIDNPDYLEIMADMTEGKPLGRTFKTPYEFSNWYNQR